jgi:hypothetical protein
MVVFHVYIFVRFHCFQIKSKAAHFKRNLSVKMPLLSPSFAIFTPIPSTLFLTNYFLFLLI